MTPGSGGSTLEAVALEEESFWIRLAAWAIMPLPPMWPFSWPRSTGGRWLIWLPGVCAYFGILIGIWWVIHRYGTHGS